MNEQNFETMRRAMVASQLRTTAVSDPRLVAAMAGLPRERFVPVERAGLAYLDGPVPVAAGRSLNVPVATGRLLTEAQVLPGDHVLVVGAATGYSAALLARLAGSVVALESNPALAEQARENLASLTSIDVVEGPLEAGWRAEAPYDLILIDGAVEAVPDALIEQLAENGGRLATGIVDGSVTRLAIGRRSGSGFGLTSFADAEAVPLPSFSKPKSFSF